VLGTGGLGRLGAPVATGGFGPRGIAVSPDGERLYVSLGLSDEIALFDIQRDGKITRRGAPLRLQGCSPTPGNPPIPQCATFWLSITPDGRNLYATNQDSDELVAFAVAADGELTEVGRMDVGPRPEGITITADRRFLFLNGIDSNRVESFAIRTDGTLAFLGAAPICEQVHIPAACGAVAHALAPDGKTLYAVTTFLPANENTVVTFRVGVDGLLTRIGVDRTGGERPIYQAVVIRPNQGPVAALQPARGTVGEPVQLDASGARDPDGRVARYDWMFGDGTALLDGGPTPVHVFAARGEYRVTVTVTDDEGCSDRLVFTGQTDACHGSTSAVASRVIPVRP
jgi:DNA-binding beta-propeller fold protein YncE